MPRNLLLKLASMVLEMAFLWDNIFSSMPASSVLNTLTYSPNLYETIPVTLLSFCVFF